MKENIQWRRQNSPNLYPRNHWIPNLLCESLLSDIFFFKYIFACGIYSEIGNISSGKCPFFIRYGSECEKGSFDIFKARLGLDKSMPWNLPIHAVTERYSVPRPFLNELFTDFLKQNMPGKEGGNKNCWSINPGVGGENLIIFCLSRQRRETIVYNGP